MQTIKLHQDHNSDCIVFAAGWGMDPAPFRMIATGSHDIVMIYDYDRLDTFFLAGLKQQYERLHLVAWSLGVWVAAVLFSQEFHVFTNRIAINGTLTPIDDERGIKKHDVDAMIDNFSLPVLQRFYRNMFTDKNEADLFLANRPERSLKNIGLELIRFKEQYSRLGPAADIYSEKVVGVRDRIFPARSQVRAWSRDKCTVRPVPHFPFYQWRGLVNRHD